MRGQEAAAQEESAGTYGAPAGLGAVALRVRSPAGRSASATDAVLLVVHGASLRRHGGHQTTAATEEARCLLRPELNTTGYQPTRPLGLARSRPAGARTGLRARSGWDRSRRRNDHNPNRQDASNPPK